MWFPSQATCLENPHGGGRLTMWSGAGAAIGVVTKLMDMHASLSRGVATLDIIGDSGWRRFGRLFEGDGTANGRVTSKYCHCCRRRVSRM